MKYGVGIAAATIIVAVILWFAWIAENEARTAADDFESADVEKMADESAESPSGASTEGMIDPEIRDRPQTPDDAADLFGRASPAEIEDAILQRIAEQSGLEFTSLNSVGCDENTCTIVFGGTAVNPQYVGEYGDLPSALTSPPWKDYQPTSSSISTREVSPGSREYVIAFTYVALVDGSADPEIAARQHAACAGAWARVTQQRGSDDYIRGAHERAAEWLEVSARVLGLEEAQRLADELQFGPLTRDCRATPY